MRRLLSGIMLIQLVLGLSILSFNIRPAGSTPGTIIVPDNYSTIQAAVDAASAGNTVYVRAGTYVENVVVNMMLSLVGEDAENTTIDGGDAGNVVLIVVDEVNVCGFTIQNSGSYSYCGGIRLEDSSYCNITGNNITNNFNGIRSYGSSYCNITGNNITNNRLGIDLDYYSDHNTISENNVTNNMVGVLLFSSDNIVSGNIFVNDGLHVGLSYPNVVVGNLVNGKPLVYLEGVSDVLVEDAGQVILVNCNRIRVENLNLSHTAAGVELRSTNNTAITGNKLTNNYVGISLWYSSNNTVSGNNIANNRASGVDLYEFSDYNIVSGNNIANNTYYGGIWLQYSSSNVFYHNNFIDNIQQVCMNESGYANIWDDGYPSGGNYWSDYAGADLYSGPSQDELGSDGIGDTSYVIESSIEDHYPLMNAWVWVQPAEGHDVTVMGIATCKDVCAPFPTLGQNCDVDIEVIVANQGEYSETFFIFVLANSTVIDWIQLALPSVSSTVLVVTWSAALPYGNYTIGAVADTVPGEIDTADNFLEGETIHIGVVGDINGDGIVEMMDFFAACQAYLSTPEKLNWNPNADINNDYVVEMMDFYMMSQHYLEREP
jgi:parallel beta-helix repeat protein